MNSGPCEAYGCDPGGSCGGGIVGDGTCEDPYHCCSIYGYCGAGPEYGCTSSPTISPAPIAPTIVPAPTPVVEENTRLIAYMGNWQTCPSADQIAQYTHIVIAFAVSYTYRSPKNNCSPTCEISYPSICNGGSQALVDQWRSMGKKVILSFGGAGMGGSWAGDVNDCWEYCYGREPAVTDRLVEIVNDMNLDGVDLDFEYFVTPKATTFLNQVTIGLKNKLPAGSEITHAPMDPDIMPAKPYYENVLKVTGHLLDFLMPQYYNGFTRPAIDGVGGTGSGSVSALSHYTDIVNDIYGGDANRIVFGFCISDCSGTGSNANALQASTVMTDLADTYPCNGGAFFWVVSHDVGASWSISVSSTINDLASTGCLASPTRTPTMASINPTTPILTPTTVPTPAPTPASTPTLSPVSDLTSSPTTAPTTVSDPTANPTSLPTPSPNPVPTTNPTTSPTVAPTSSPTPGSTGGEMCCPEGYTGLRAWDNCNQYYHCAGGVVSGSAISVAAGTFFDQSKQNVVWDWEMDSCIMDNCGSTPTLSPVSDLTSSPTTAPTSLPTPSPNPVPTTNPTTSPTVAPTSSPTPGSTGGEMCCPEGYTGLRAWDNCNQYYHCAGGVVSGSAISVAAGTFFDQSKQNVVWDWEMDSCIMDNCRRRGLRGSIRSDNAPKK